MERIEFWRNELQGARLYDGRAKNNFSRICAALEANSSTSFSAACVGSLRQSGGGYLPTRRPRAKDSNTDTTSRRHNAVRAKRWSSPKTRRS
jgi:hypothetical protein